MNSVDSVNFNKKIKFQSENLKNKSLEIEKTPTKEDKGLSTAAKLMIGATALGGLAALFIFTKGRAARKIQNERAQIADVLCKELGVSDDIRKIIRKPASSVDDVKKIKKPMVSSGDKLKNVKKEAKEFDDWLDDWAMAEEWEKNSAKTSGNKSKVVDVADDMLDDIDDVIDDVDDSFFGKIDDVVDDVDDFVDNMDDGFADCG